MKLATPAVIGLIALSLAGCTAAATSGPTRSAVAPSPSMPAVPSAPAIVEKLPSSCDALYAGLTDFMSDNGSLVLNPAWKSGPGVPRAGFGTYDAALGGMLSKSPGLICDWAPATGPSDTFLTTQLRHVDVATGQAATARMRAMGWFCGQAYSGQWCVTNDDSTGRSIGESHWVGQGYWIASNWNNAGPRTYTPELLKRLFG
ncbi:hypothetical protein [Leifsonia shinshuensis]|uniref:hypothetical protein n=1 Tax=Leifsonia TaxID=110932 RepID=UPI00285D8A6B|nr:hypothetical protein [Leifsonia shinshuensis]MDR6969761.1 hypothetical protein [Leifsonia shinshuensis]